MLIPQITTFADPTVVEGPSGRVHDASWLVETRLVATPVIALLDGTGGPFQRPFGARYDLASAFGDGREGLRDPLRQRQLYDVTSHHDALVDELPGSEAIWIQVGGGLFDWLDPAVPDWIEPWREGLRMVQVERVAPTVLVELAPRFPAGAVVLLVGAGELFTPRVVGALREARPDLRLFDARPRARSPLDAHLVASGGGRLHYHFAEEATFPALQLAIEPGRDAELVIHAERSARDRHAVFDRPPLVEVDRVRVDAVMPHVDEPAFTVTAAIRAPRAAWTVVAHHEARRAGATLPSEDQMADVERRVLVPVPEVRPLAPRPYHDARVTGALVFRLGGRVERVPLAPAVVVANAAGAVALEIVGGEVVATGRGGAVLFRGTRLRHRGIATRYETREVPGVARLLSDMMIELADDEALELGEVSLSVELGRGA